MSSPEAIRDSVYALVECADLEALKRATPADFDWTQLNRLEQHPLVLLIDRTLNPEFTNRAIKCASWMISQGASPSQPAGPDCEVVSQFNLNPDCGCPDATEENSGIEAEHAGFTAIEVATWLKQQMEGNEHWTKRGDDIEAMDRLLAAFTAAPLDNPKNDMQAVDASVVGMWEQVLTDEACQDLKFECEGGRTVGAHALVLSCASPVLRAMVHPESQTLLREGSERKIEVSDSSEAAVKLFLELVYTGGTSVDPLTAADALAALDLAHRWQVVGVVSMLERAIVPLIKKQTFSEIAETAVLKGLALLSSSCVKYAQKKNAVVDELAEKGELSPAVLSLIGKSMSATGEPASKKRRLSL